MAIDYYMQRFRNFRGCPSTDIRDCPPSLQTGDGTRRYQLRERLEPRILAGQGLSATRFRAPVLLFKRPRQPFFYVRDPNGWGSRPWETLKLVTSTADTTNAPEPHVRLIGQTSEPVASDKKPAKGALRAMGAIKRSTQLI